MESQQTPRSPEDPVMGRGSPMVKQNPQSPGPGFQVRPQGHPPLSPRFPINNGSVGGPRIGGQQGPILHRLDSRSSLGSPTGPGGQFVQSRPPFGPPRPQNPQGNQIPGSRQPLPANPQGLQGGPRYPGPPPGSPSVRPPPNNSAGPRPPIYSTNQPQQIYYQPRIGEVRQQRPINSESGAQPQIRFGPAPPNPENRYPGPQIIPDTVVTPPRNDWPLRDGRANNQSGGFPGSTDPTNDRRSQPVVRQGHPRDKMEVIDSRSPTPGVTDSEPSKNNAREENDNIPKRKPSPRVENENDDDDDDDVVMDRDKEHDQKITVPEKMSNDTLKAEFGGADPTSAPASPASVNSYKKSATPSPIPPAELQDRPGSVNSYQKSATPSPIPPAELQDRPGSVNSYQKSATPSPVPPAEHQDRPDSVNSYKKSATPSPVPPEPQDRPESVNSYKKSATPSPVPPAESQDRPGSAVKMESSDEPPGDKLSSVPSPVPSEDKSRDTSQSESRLDDTPKSAEPSMGDVSKHTVESPLKMDASDVEDHADLGLEKRSESRSSSIRSAKSPIPPRTPDHLATLSVPGSPSPQLQKSPTPSKSPSPIPPKSPVSPNSPISPKSQKSPQGSVKGFDNGQLRSLSPKSPVSSISPASPNAPKSPIIPTSAESEKKKTTFAENSEDQTTKTNGEETRHGEGEKTRPMTPGNEAKPPTPSKVSERAQTPGTPDGRKSSMKRSTSGRSIKSDAGSDSGANQTNQGAPTTNGVSVSPTKKVPSKSREGEKRTTAASPVKSPSKSVKSLPRTPEAGPPSTVDKKKVPMNKVQVGAAPSPNLKTVRSKIGSLDNASYKPGGGKVKIENRKLDFSKAQPKIAAKNDKYMPSGGDKKITQVKLQWNAKPKVGSLDNATYKPGGGDKKIETVKLDFKDKAKPKVGSKDNAKHVPGGGTVKSTVTPPKTPQDPPSDIETQKIDIKAESKIGSLDNVKHKPGGGDKKIFNDKDYLRQTGSNVESLNGSGAQIKPLSVAERPTFIEMKSNPPEPNPPPTTPTRSRPSSAMSPVTPRALRTSLQTKSPDSPTAKRVSIAEVSSPSSARKGSISRRPKTPSSPGSGGSGGSSRPPSSLDIKSATEKSPKSSRKSSPNGLHLPKLTATQSTDNGNDNASVQDSPKIKLPKLLETSKLSNRVELNQ